ncbi:MAG: hypothetical protein Q4C87_09780, partial [Actinomycetaceae bacterium]|nr:hypothetical protein [Actinomycetaceae bacterium]
MISVVGFVYPYPEQCAFEFRQRYGDRVGSQWALALYGLVDGAACEPVTQEAFFGLLEASFFADPVPFDPQWDSYVVPPEYPWSSWRKEYDPARP